MTADRDVWRDLTEKLEDPDSKVRLAALEEAGTHDAIQAVRLMLKAITDNSNQIRKRAGELLIEKQHPATVSGLIAHLDSEKFHVRHTATELLSRLPRDRVFPQLNTLMEDESLEPALRLHLIPLFVRHSDDANISTIESLISSQDPAIRKAALDGLCQIESSWTIPILLKLLESEEPEIVDKVSACLQRRSDPLIRDGLVDAMARQTASGDRAVALLSQICTKQDVGRLSELLHSDNLLLVQRAFRLLTAIAPDQVIDSAFNFLASPDELLRDTAVDFILNRPYPTIKNHITETLLKDDAGAEILLQEIVPCFPVSTLLDLADNPALVERILTVIKALETATICNFIEKELAVDPIESFQSRARTIARLGRIDTIHSFKTLKLPETAQTFLTDLEAEIRFRSALSRAGYSHEDKSIETIEATARDRGWESDVPLDRAIVNAGSVSSKANRRSELLDEVRRSEKAVLKYEPMLARVEKSLVSESRRIRWRRTGMVGVVVGFIGAAVCMYMNWQPVDHGLWYLGLVLSTVVIGFGIFSLRKTARKLPGESVSKDPQSARADLRQKLDNAQATLDAAQKALDEIESSLGSGNTAGAGAAITDLIRRLSD